MWAEATNTNQWAFHSVNCPAMKRFITKIWPSYRLPSAYRLANSLLDSISTNVDAENVKMINKAANLTVFADGWTDVNNTSLMNIALFAGSGSPNIFKVC